MRVVTIDGPAGAGKSTVARAVAEQLGWQFLDTGAMYRAVALAGLTRGIPLNDAAALAALADRLDVRLDAGQVWLDGADVSLAIRRPAVTAATRHAAENAGVRARLVGWQRAFAADHDTVTEGRDQGTVVFPDALRKFFLTAAPAERARRRHAELVAQGQSVSLATVFEDQLRRDAADESRHPGPASAGARRHHGGHDRPEPGGGRAAPSDRDPRRTGSEPGRVGRVRRERNLQARGVVVVFLVPEAGGYKTRRRGAWPPRSFERVR